VKSPVNNSYHSGGQLEKEMTMATQRLLLAIIITASLLSFSAASTKEKPVKSTVPLSPDEVAVYKLILQQRVSHEQTLLNVSARTFPLDAANSLSGLSDVKCMKGILLENLSSVSHSFHELTTDVLPDKGTLLVDPDEQAKIVHANDPSRTIGKGKPVESAVREAFETALFSMSEIAFDKEHHYAAVSYHFWCGGLCGNGATVILEKIDGQWTTTDRVCASWIS